MSGPDLLETVRWRDGAVRILDQTRLPGEEVYLQLTGEQEVTAAIRRLAVRGAPAIGVAGALALALAVRASRAQSSAALLDDLHAASARVGSARPTAVNLRWACERVVSRLERCVEPGGGHGAHWTTAEKGNSVLERIRAEVLAEGLRILEEDLALSRAMAEHGYGLLPEEGRVVTHCNTGGLATAGGGTALGVILTAFRRGKRLFVHVDETRPLLQGARLTAWELARAGVPYAIQCDGAAAWLMKSRRIDGVFVGADRVALNGDTANKVGTLGLALAAREFGVPFYVVAPRSSFDLSLPDGSAIPIEERPPAEVLQWEGQVTAPAGADAFNPAFDVTPAAWITAWVTERGVEQPPFDP